MDDTAFVRCKQKTTALQVFVFLFSANKLLESKSFPKSAWGNK